MSKGKKTALLGGSFDPVHKGHIKAAVQIREKLNLDKVVFVPNRRNPLKKNKAQAEAGMRVEMLKLAASGIQGLEVSTMETEKKTVSYTADTLRSWKTLQKEDSLWFVMGEELFSDITKWKNFREIFENANVAVISRPVPGKPSGRGRAPELPFEIRRNFIYDNQLMGTFSFRHKSGSILCFVEMDSLEVSSTEIRNRIKNGIAFEHLVPKAVADFIKRKKLYSEEPRT